nr:DUF3499 domain-containing protein [Austwickia sp. TVS 96-490-7B]
MTVMRRCSKTACSRAAVATLTYNYAEQTAVLGPLATFAEPHTYDLCATHATRLTAPQGWDVVRLVGEFVEGAQDDLFAVVDALNARPVPPMDDAAAAGEQGETDQTRAGGGGRRTAQKPAPLGRPQLRVLRDS